MDEGAVTKACASGIGARVYWTERPFRLDILAVGQRSSTVTVIQLVQAFLEQRTWKQADLAKRLDMTTPAVREKLKELASVFGLESEKDHPHVYWSVPKNWFPGGVMFSRDQLPDLMRLVLRSPSGKARTAVLEAILRHLPKDAATSELTEAVVPPEGSQSEDAHLSTVEDSAARKVTLRFRYYTASRGDFSTRYASVHRVVPGHPARFIATCHRANALRWFRVEHMTSAELDANQPYRNATKAAVDKFLRASLDGFNAGGEATTHSFVVRPPEARWVPANLLPAMRSEPLSDGRIRVTVETNAIHLVARFVVGLGAAATAETPELAAAVVELARGALASHAPAGAPPSKK